MKFSKVRHSSIKLLKLANILKEVAGLVKNFAIIYFCDLDLVGDFNQMYELWDPVTIMVWPLCLPVSLHNC